MVSPFALLQRLREGVENRLFAIGTRRNPTGDEPCEIWSPERLPELLAIVDDLVLCAPLTDATRRMIGAAEVVDDGQQLGQPSTSAAAS